MAAIPAGVSSFISSGISPVSEGPDRDRIGKLLKQNAPLKWIFTGDSITAGVEHTHGYRSYPEIFGERIRFEMGRSRDIVINTAISGNVLQDILTDFDWRVAQFKPAVVSLMIGTNDCARSGTNTDIFKRELETFLARIRKGGGIPILQTPNIIINERAAERAHLSAYVAVIQDIAKEEQVILVDNWRNWQDTLQKHPEVNVYKNWLNDPLHPNGTGHNEIARSLFKELSIFDPAAATCGGKYYEGEH